MKKILFGVFISLLLTIILTISVLYTSFGTKLADKTLQTFAQKYVTYSDIRGVLARDVEITNCKFFTPQLDISAEKVHLKWNLFALFKQKIVVSTLDVNELLFAFKKGNTTVTKPKSDKPFVLSLPEKISPFDIYLGALSLKGIGFAAPSGAMVEHLDTASLSATIVDTDLTITKLEIEDTAYGISLAGKAVTGSEWWADVSGSWRFSNWDGGELLGSLSATGPLPNMDVKVELLAPTYVDIVGKMKGLPGNPYFDVVGKGDYTALPVIHPNIPDIRLDALVHATGFINDYKAELETTGEYFTFKAIKAKGTLWGNLEEIHFPTMRFTHQKTVVNLVGAYLDWDERFVVGGQVIPQHFNPGVIDERFQGDLTGLIDGKLTVEYGDDGKIFGWYSLKDVQGTLREYPVTGGVDLRFTDSSLRVDRIEAFSGESHLLYKGQFEDELDMSLAIVSPNIQEIYPDGTGRINMSATLKGSYETPRLKAQISATDIKVMDVRIASIKGSAKNSEKKQGDYQIDLDTKDFSLYGEDARNGHIHFDGSLEKHQGQVNLSRRKAALNLQFTGSLIDGVWTTLFTQGTLQHDVFGNWKQEGKSTFVIDSEHLHLTNFMLKNRGAKINLSGEYLFGDDGDYTLSGVVDDYYLSQIQTIFGSVDDPYELSGKLDSSFTLQGNTTQLSQADIVVKTDNVTIVFPASAVGGREQIVSKKAVLSAKFDGEKVTATFDVDANASTIKSELKLLWSGQWNTDPHLVKISGTTSLKNVNLATLASQTNYLVESKGKVFGNFTLSGNLAKPLVEGHVELTDGNIFLPDQGIELENIKVNVKGNRDALQIDGRFFSGGGMIHTQGSLRYDIDRGIVGNISGEGSDFLLLDIPEYTIYASPDVHVSFDKNAMRIEGDVNIPKGKLSSAKNAIDRVTESEDVVVIDLSTGKQEKGYMVSAALKVHLGEDVQFSRFGINGRLAGQLYIEEGPTIPLRGTGDIFIKEGTFSAYGRKLEIGRGKISYAGGPLVNPGLDVRVQKQVRVQTGTMQGLYSTVGIDISGYANNINYTLFSSPYMDDADILSYLLLGHSLFSASDDESNILAEAASSFGWKRGASLISKIAAVVPVDDVHLESGVDEYDMSVVVGKNITKDLYVGYDYNVLDQLGEILLRYNLKYGFFIESTTSQDSTGADLLYIFEK